MELQKYENAEEVKNQGVVALDTAEAFIVNNSESVTKATEFTKKIKVGLKQLEDKRKAYTKPLLESKKQIDDDFKAFMQPFKDAEKVLKKKIGDYQMEVIRKQREEQEKLVKIEQELKRELPEARKEMDKAMETAKQVKSDDATASTRTVWKFEVLDENKVPVEFKIVDERKIREAVKNGAREIDGVRIYEDVQISIR